MRILVVDAQKIMRGGIKSLLENQVNYHVIVQAESAEKALDLLIKIEVDLIITDMTMGTKESLPI